MRLGRRRPATLERASSGGKGLRIDVSGPRSLVAIATVLGGLFAVASLAGAQSGDPGSGAHLLVVPDTARGELALERTDARVLARYPAFALVESAGTDEDALRDAGAYRRDDLRRVRLPGGRFDPAARDSLAAKDAPEPDDALVVVQFAGPVKEEWLAGLRETGARVVHYVAQNGYLVYAEGAALERVAALVGGPAGVRAATPVRPEDKLAATGGAVAVQTVAGQAGEEARGRVAAAAAELRDPSQVEGVRTQFARLEPSLVHELAADPGVIGVAPYALPELHDERGAQIAAGNITGNNPSGPGFLPWLEGKGFATSGLFNFTIDVTDSGLDSGNAAAPAHSDFRQEGLGAGTSRVTYANNHTLDPGGARDCTGHGTNVASIAAGFGVTGSGRVDGSGYRHGMGMAPRARLGASKIFACDGKFELVGTYTNVASSAYAAGARISNNSWGIAVPGQYSAESAEYDALVRDAAPGAAGNQQLVEVFTAGNDGDEVSGNGNEGYASITAPGTAKNVITVGASESVRSLGGDDGCGVIDSEANDPEDIINFSGRGPTDDGRRKPDLVAPGTHMVGAAPQHGAYTGNGTCTPSLTGTGGLYSVISGTSQAAPHVSGAAALVRDWYQREVSGGTPPSPALTKALLVNTATDIAGGLTGKGGTTANVPNADQGWGRLNLGAVLDGSAREYHDQTDLLDASGQSVTRAYDVPNAGAPVKVTLAWTDAPGLPSSDAFVNDLDLVVTAGGRRYRGNVIAEGLSIPGGAADPRNNLESVYLPAGAAGRIAVEVVGAGIGGDGVPGSGDLTDQDFALVVSNASETDAPVLAEESRTLSDGAPGGDDDDALEPGESFTLRETLRNHGDVGATGITSSMAGVPQLSFSQTSSTYPNAAPGATTTAAADYAGQLSAGATCGVDMTPTLNVTTAEGGVEAIPIVLPTGFAGPAIPRSSSGGPVAIPDDSATGVTSTITVPAGSDRIKDVDVSISGITHGWVGDLRIDVIGPDGTTVNLAQHPGGPDNSGNNFSGTVFDDEAAVNISSAAPPYSGSFRPQRDQLSRFDGKQVAGTWTLRVRDLYEGDTGTLAGWGTNTRPARCARNPQTTLDSAPSGLVESDAATLAFSATESPGSPPFECSLDNAPFSACTSPQSLASLADGEHSFRVRAIDADGDPDETPAEAEWTVDTEAPVVSVAAPAAGATVFTPRPALSGTAGRAFGDSATVTVKVFAGAGTSGPVAQTLSTTRSGATGAWSVTASTLPDGVYTVRAEQADAASHTGLSNTHTFTITADEVAPIVTLTEPAAGAVVSDTTPRIAGSAGRLPGDDGVVKVKLFNGTLAAGLPAQTLFVPRDAGTGAWSVDAAALADGPYTVQAEQADTAGHVGVSNSSSFGIKAPVGPTPPAPPSVLMAPAEEDLGAALAGRLTVLVSCTAGCSAKTGLSLSPRTARRLGAPVKLGSGSAALAQGGTVRLRLRMSRAARSALRSRAAADARLRVEVNEGAGSMTVSRTIGLRRAGRLRRTVRGGLPLITACSASCSLAGSVTVSRSEARRLGLPAAGSGRVEIASGSSSSGPKGARTVLRIRRSARGPLGRARSASVLAGLLARTANGGERQAGLALTLRR